MVASCAPAASNTSRLTHHGGDNEDPPTPRAWPFRAGGGGGNPTDGPLLHRHARRSTFDADEGTDARPRSNGGGSIPIVSAPPLPWHT